MYVCVHTVDRYDLEIAVLTLKFPMGCFYVVLNTTFIITSEVTTVTFKEGRSIHRLSFRSYILMVYLPFVNFHTFFVLNVSSQLIHSYNFPSGEVTDTALMQ